MIKIGVSRADITPHAGIELGGFGKRIQPSLGVIDPLYATAIVASDNRRNIAMINCDLTNLTACFISKVKTRIEEKTGIPGDHIMISCTHTHYGPILKCANEGDKPLSYEEIYTEYLVYQLAGIVFEAMNSMEPAKLSVGFGISDIGINRREKTIDGNIILGNNPEGPIDRSLGVLRIDTLSGNPLATIVNFATHPVTQEPQIRLASSDYPGYMRNIVEQNTGSVCLFWQGATGDINPIFAEKENTAAITLGKRLGCEVVRVYESVSPLDDAGIHTVTRYAEVPANRFLSKEHAIEKLKEAQMAYEFTKNNPSATEGLIHWHEQHLKKVEILAASWTDSSLIPPPVVFELKAFRIGEFAWACAPCELFNQTGLAIKNNSPYKYTFFAGYTNGANHYVPTPDAYEEGGYEVDYACFVGPEATEILIDNFKEMFDKLK